MCGEPYLTYHHFDPPWAERHHDEPEGIIALCVKHAGMADAKAFTKKQLRVFKRLPSNKGTTLESTFEWFRQNLLFIVGGNIAFKCNTIVASSRKRNAEGSRDLIAQVSSDMVKEFDEEVPLCTVTGTFYSPQKAILRANEMIYGGVTIGCNYIGTTNTAFHFG